ncbi:hypothetical protein [Burkholderia vietnamiensis]|uniref:hypothetical protein n=1 Tax=Burkholderia vietnamiensis TaxID=60552 RepID=UPI001CF41538|nr:hypothetical protein [Burkholderia vietnamiensis]MCA8228322.1 hypothetical protein [Burkholderia vietnamiensis]
MDRNQYEGDVGRKRLKAMIRAVYIVRGKAQGTQEFLLGWVYGLVDAGALNEDGRFAAQQYIVHRGFEDGESSAVDLYVYPNDSYRRVEGKSLYDLEREIMEGGPFQESRDGRIFSLAGDPEHVLHFIAKHFLFLSRAQLASTKVDD